MSPEILGALRILLMTGGSFAVGKGWLQSAELNSLVDALLILLVAGTAAWSIYAKRSRSKEAQVIAGRVIADPEAHPIAPPPEEI